MDVPLILTNFLTKNLFVLEHVILFELIFRESVFLAMCMSAALSGCKVVLLVPGEKCTPMFVLLHVQDHFCSCSRWKK